MQTIKAKQTGNAITYKAGRRVLCTITEREKVERYSVHALPELKNGEKYYKLYTPVCAGCGFSSAWGTLEEAIKRAENYVKGLMFGEVEIIY